MKKLVVGCATLLFLAFMFVTFIFWDYGRVKDWGVQTEAPEWLPEAASKVTFLETGSRRVAEFMVDKDSFIEWCEQSGRSLTPISENEERTVHRPNYELAEHGKIEMLTMPDKRITDEDLAEYRTWNDVTLEEGDLIFLGRKSNSGGYILAYDTSEGMGYYSYSHR